MARGPRAAAITASARESRFGRLRKCLHLVADDELPSTSANRSTSVRVNWLGLTLADHRFAIADDELPSTKSEYEHERLLYRRSGSSPRKAQVTRRKPTLVWRAPDFSSGKAK